MKRIKPSDRIEQWKILSSRTVLTGNEATHTVHTSNNYDAADDNDPFDCSDLIVPSTSKIIKNILKDKVKEWEELDSRIIIPDPDDDDDDDDKSLPQDNTDKNMTTNQQNEMPSLDGKALKETEDNDVQDRKKPRQYFHLNVSTRVHMYYFHVNFFFVLFN